MKWIRSVIILGVVMLLLIPISLFASAPDTVYVGAFPAGNINSFIQGDTLTNGQRAHPNRVYKLYRDSIYYFTGQINVSFPIAIIADTGSKRPPLILPAILQDNSSPGTFLNVSSGTGRATLKNLYMLGVRPDQKLLGWGACININGDSIRFVIDHCVIDNWSDAGINDNSGKASSFFLTNNTFRNMMHPTSWFGGQPFFANGGAPTDTIEIINNTMFCNNSYVDCNVDYNKYTLFEHNTVFLTTVNPINDFAASNVHYLNNIFYGTCAEAQTKDEIAGWWFDDAPYGSSTFSFDSMNVYFSPPPITESQRVITIMNNSVYWPSKITNFWKTPLMDTLTPPYFMNARTRRMFGDKTNWPYLYQAGNDSTSDPGFPASVLGQIDSLTKYVTLTRTGGLATYLWYYNPNNQLFPPAWPLPENLRYTNSTMIHGGSDGYALGDLNWFPEQLATWRLTDVPRVLAPVPRAFTLSEAYPNPFNPSTRIQYTLNKAGVTSLKVYNILGQLVSTVVDNVNQDAGTYNVTVDMSHATSGVYFYILAQGGNRIAHKMLLLK